MKNEELEALYNKMKKVHEKAQEIFKQGNLSSMIKNEYKNKVSQYDSMYQSLEDMKALSDKEDTVESLITQQAEVLNVRIKWQLDWAKRAITSSID